MDFKYPPLPNTLAEILQVLSQEDSVPDNGRLVDLIERDPATALYIFREVNSAYYGVQRSITQLDQAVAFLGWKKVFNLVLTAAMNQTFSYLENAAAQNVYERIMQTSVAAAAFARDLAEHLQLRCAETAFSAGLLHQLGRLVLLYNAPHQYVPLWYERVATSDRVIMVVPSLESEQAHFNTNYVQLGASIMQRWGLPTMITTTIDYLHRPDQVSLAHLRMQTHVVAAGCAIAEELFASDPSGGDASEKIDAIPPPVVELARVVNTAVWKLVGFLDTRREEVLSLAHTVMG